MILIDFDNESYYKKLDGLTSFPISPIPVLNYADKIMWFPLLI